MFRYSLFYLIPLLGILLSTTDSSALRPLQYDDVPTQQLNLKQDVCDLWLNGERQSNELKRLIFTGVRPFAATNAGKYSRAKVSNWNDCVSKCCEFQRCNVAYWIQETCLHIECLSDEMCKPIKDDNDDTDTVYLQLRSVDSTAALLDFEDPGVDDCNETLSCPKHEECEKIQINANLQRNVCSCKEKNYRLIDGVCRQYLSHTSSCHLYINAEECDENEECVRPSDRAKHGYCQCKLGFIRTDRDACIREEQESRLVIKTTKPSSTSVPAAHSQFIVNAGDDETLTFPVPDEIILHGHVLFQLNKSEISFQDLLKVNRNFVLKWSYIPSRNVQPPVFDQINELLKIKHFTDSGVYEFELKLLDNELSHQPVGTDTVKITVLRAATTTLAPFALSVHTPELVHLPQSAVYLYANVSSNRKIKYEWKYMEDGPTTPKMQGTDMPQLLLHDLRPGNYTFRIHVRDDINNEQAKIIQMVVDGEPIRAKVGNRKQVVFWPTKETILDGTLSVLESFIQCTWTLIDNNGKSNVINDDIVITQPQSLKTSVQNLHIGHYKFQLKLVTNDKKYVSRDYVDVLVYAQNGQPPEIQLLTQTNVNILKNLIVIDASKTRADYGIASWKWTRTPESPAGGRFINNSDLSPIAMLTQLHVGLYTFVLKVTDDRSQVSSQSVNITVEPLNEDGKDLFEIQFQTENNALFTEQMLNNLLLNLRVFLTDLQPQSNITVISISDEQLLLVASGDNGVALKPQRVVEHLRPKLKSINQLFKNIKISDIDSYLCLHDCSRHGVCDKKTKQCRCDKYYMENWYKKQFQHIPNCDFRLPYVVLFSMSGIILLWTTCWLLLCCCLRIKRRRYLLAKRKRIRYQLLEEDDNTARKKKEKLYRKKKGDSKSTNVVISESDEITDQDEETLYDKPLLTSSSNTAVSSKGFLSKKVSSKSPLSFPVQDNNGSPLVVGTGGGIKQDQTQSSPATDNSVA